MNNRGQWLIDLGNAPKISSVDGLVPVRGYQPEGRPPNEVAIIEKAEAYGADAVFFEASHDGRPAIPQALVYVSDGPANDPGFAEVHKRVWSWGGVPLIYRKAQGLLQLFRCAHKPDFVSENGKLICKPYSTLKISESVASDPWWDASRLRNGTLWDDPAVCNQIVSAQDAVHKRLFDAIRQLNADLNKEELLRKHLRRKLLILSLLIAYLEARGVFPPGYFAKFRPGAKKFFEVLADGKALVALLDELEHRFNGNVFTLEEPDRKALRASTRLRHFAEFIEAREEKGGQLTLWDLYSFKDLPVELISHIYQLFVKDSDSSVYTPPFLVRLMLDEALSWERLDRLHKKNETILDPCCGSGVFLVEAYKRLVLHWRSRNHWKLPDQETLRTLLQKIQGVDLEAGAIELAAFSLCLALCDALKPETIRASIKLFPVLMGKTLHRSCFFEAKKTSLLKTPIGVVLGNPPFKSSLNTRGAKESYDNYQEEHGLLPDKQLAYLFLHESMGLIASGGMLCMLQAYNLLYNQNSESFRRTFFAKWDVREILDFISVRGLFRKGEADTKVVVIVAEASNAPKDRRILHATFRRGGRVEAGQGFDIDYYDLHWLPRDLVLENDAIWRSDLLGGVRALEFVTRLKRFPTLGSYAESRNWDFGEGFIEAKPKNGKGQKLFPAEHVTGKRLLPSSGLTESGIDPESFTTVETELFRSAYTPARFTPPMVLVHQQFNLNHGYWGKGYLTYKNQIVGFCGGRKDVKQVRAVAAFLEENKRALQAYVAGASVKLFTQHATTLSATDVISLPYPKDVDLSLSPNEKILIDDVVDYYRDFIRLGEGSEAMMERASSALDEFGQVFTQQINAIYSESPIRALVPQSWTGVVCYPFVFGDGVVDWTGAEALQDRLDKLLHEQRNSNLHVTRIARIYDGRFVFLLKPDRLRYWLRSIALQDADETIGDLQAQGF